jgi:NADH-quinone oxidoreductase subunit C
MDTDNRLEKIKNKFTDAVQSISFDRVGCPIVFVKKDKLIDLLTFLKSDGELSYDFLSDLTCYDDYGKPEEVDGRFVMVYNLYSPALKERIRIKCRVADGDNVPTATCLWAAANWAEREVWDMYGVRFDGHPDLRRILMDERFQGHPQRKDYYWRKYQLFLDAEPMPETLFKD